VIDPLRFKAPFLTPEVIRSKADEIRSKYWPSGTIPIDIEKILWGIGLRLEPVPFLKESDVDAFLSADLTGIWVDADQYMDDRMLNRVRFSIAHELGHFVLHEDIYKQMAFTSLEEKIKFIQLLPDDQYGFIEQHAYEFAGRPLVPRDALQKELGQAVAKAKDAGFTEWDKSGDAALEHVASSICRTFEVSSLVIEKRLVRE